MKYTIQTRQNSKGNWWCNGTIDGYDYSFEGPTISSAQSQMIELLNSKGLSIRLQNWEDPQGYHINRKGTFPKIGYQKVRIDYNPQG